MSADGNRNEPAAQPAGLARLLFIPDRSAPSFLLWGPAAAANPLAVGGEPATQWLSDDALSLRRVSGYRIPLLEAVMQLAAMTRTDLERATPSVAVWSLAAKLALELVARERLVPVLEPLPAPSTRKRAKASGDTVKASWRVVLSLPQDAERVNSLARAFPIAAHAVPISIAKDAPQEIWTADALLHEFLDTVADEVVRHAVLEQKPKRSRADDTAAPTSWPQQFVSALTTRTPVFQLEVAQPTLVLDELQQWTRTVLAANAGHLHLCLALKLPTEGELFELQLQLRSMHSDARAVSAHEIFAATGTLAALDNCAARSAQELLLQNLAVAARIFLPIEAELRKPQPENLRLKPRLAWDFVTHASAALQQAGIVVQLPAELAPSGQQRLQLRMCLGLALDGASFDVEHEVPYVWQAELAGHAITREQLDALLLARSPLTRYHGQWVVLDPREVAHALKLLSARGGTLSTSLALSLALTETIQQTDSTLRVTVVASGALQERVQQLREHDMRSITLPADFKGELRPYQLRGVSWLAHLLELQLGACLADDMGLGKTVQLLALLLYRRAQQPEDTRPVLLVCPTSVVGNWEREMARFTPTLAAMRHYGPLRVQNAEDFVVQAQGKIVITSYGLLRRDAPWLKELEFAVVVLDEAQFIKNPSSHTARAARGLRSTERVALTGTPMENHLAELWSILEFLNPGLLGPFETFRREIAIPVERYGREEVAARLKRMVAPFILRRVKTDSSIVADLPEKLESKVFCTLTREQATLYQQAVDDSFEQIETSTGMARRGHVLALITALKQICNHPAHYLREQGPLTQRSGKLDRLCEMIDIVLQQGERILVFTQYREMGDRLVRALTRVQGRAVPFLHGGVSREARDEMVRRFQEEPQASRILVVSLKAGGTGLNLTAATQVFHFDRWWNPAVEDQATDRAYRIGQRRNVQVYKLLCAGTVEEKIDQMLESKRELAASVVGTGEAWLTELDNTALHELFALAPNAVIGDNDAEDQDERVRLRAESAPRRARTVPTEEQT